jgi:hypothetical protein
MFCDRCVLAPLCICKDCKHMLFYPKEHCRCNVLGEVTTKKTCNHKEWDGGFYEKGEI